MRPPAEPGDPGHPAAAPETTLVWRAVGADAGAAAWAEGRAMPLEQAVAYALEAAPGPRSEPG
jgi:hypothetical protein